MSAEKRRKNFGFKFDAACESGMGFPSEVVLSSTWNLELIERLGEMVGEDGLALKVVGWYAPAVNIHRNAFAGRNYEYFSEDPLLSGKAAAAEVTGAQSKGMYVYVKHFALNDQETNRIGVATFAYEQAIRELYLEPFEIAVQEGGARHNVVVQPHRLHMDGCFARAAHRRPARGMGLRRPRRYRLFGPFQLLHAHRRRP